jgi:hypothetical protein
MSAKSKAKAETLLQTMQAGEMMPHDYLLGFSHICKITFNL